jgi:Mce-associated membrane protein
MAIDSDQAIESLDADEVPKEDIVTENADGDDLDADSPADSSSSGDPRLAMRGRWTARKQLVAAATVVVMALSGVVGWLGYHAIEASNSAAKTAQMVETGRQGALNLTTIDWEHADADVERILASASGAFYDDFAQRSQPFIDVVKQTKSKSVGTIAEAGLESMSGDGAQILVAVNVKTTLQGATETAARSWRMRIGVEKNGDEMKVSNVEFVP